MSAPPKLRCAVYTRKSSEEGLDQEFNSLAAQRESCAAFIASQASLGWKLVFEPYDDGGISGGTMDRPGLQRLLRDIRDRKVDVVVVYKIDRLTRSLMDFAKIVEVFDAHGVSFVSVTQQFNTTTSMGRLTLNVLLSFAQFEREVTAERIRDKIAASKRKGMWMGGRVPLGYKVVDRKLVVDEPYAELVRFLFSRYLQLRSVPALVQEINRTQVMGRNSDADIAACWRRHERPMGRGQLYHLLSNPIYIGKLRHKGEIFEGEHDAIISVDPFETVQKLLETRAPSRSRNTNAAGIHVLTGLIFDETGDRLSPTYATKQGKRYHYYVSGRLKTGGDCNGGWRVPAVELERLVEQQAKDLLNDRTQLSGWIAEAATMEQVGIGLSAAAKMVDEISDSAAYDTRLQIFRVMFDRIILSSTNIRFIVNHRALALHLAGVVPAADDPTAEACIAVERPFNLRRRGVEARLVIGGRLDKDRAPDQSLVELIGRAHFYLSRLTGPTPVTIGELAKSVGSHPADISRILPLAYLSPAITSAILTGRQPVELTARMLARQIDLPPSWREQATIIGI